MKLQSLALRQFRNYDEASLIFSPEKNLILGPNGQGKTNLLEAVYCLSHSRSNRATTDRELVKSGYTGAQVYAELVSNRYDTPTTTEMVFKITENPETKTLRSVFEVNGIPLKSRSQVLGHLPGISFFVSDLLLLRGTPEDRRRWLDAAISQYDHRHLTWLSQYQKIRQQKSKLLKNQPHLIDHAHLAVWNEQLAEAGAHVLVSRNTYLGLLESPMTVNYLELSGCQEHLTLSYEGIRTTDFDTAKDALNAQLDKLKHDELRRGQCLTGPHRDDIAFTLDQLDARAYGSQGQQRTIVLAAKLAELALLTTRLQEPPVLLLDDVMAELDPARQQYLLAHIDPASQVFLTTTHLDASLAPFLGDKKGDIRVFEIHCGQVRSSLSTIETDAIKPFAL